MIRSRTDPLSLGPAGSHLVTENERIFNLSSTSLASGIFFHVPLLRVKIAKYFLYLLVDESNSRPSVTKDMIAQITKKRTESHILTVNSTTPIKPANAAGKPFAPVFPSFISIRSDNLLDSDL